MTEVRTKDRIFLAVALPVALAAAYWHFWRVPSAARAAALEARAAALVEEGDFPQALSRAQRSRDEARAALEAERAMPPVAERVRGNPLAPVAARERAVTDAMREAGLAVVSCADASPDALGERAAAPATALKATGACPSPVCRRIVADGAYPQVVRALNAISEREMAAVVVRLEMRGEGRSRWILEAWL